MPVLSILATRHGYLTMQERTETVSELERIGRCLVLVGMGRPPQEQWAWPLRSHLPSVTVITVGGLFDFFSDRIPRAPVVWREIGLEWLFRLRQEPRRLAARYLLGNPVFLARALKQRWTGPDP